MKIQKKRELLTAKMDEDTVMMDPVAGKYYNMGVIGGEVWQILEEPVSEGEIIDTLLHRYEVEYGVCEAEVRSFITMLQERDLIKHVE